MGEAGIRLPRSSRGPDIAAQLVAPGKLSRIKARQRSAATPAMRALRSSLRGLERGGIAWPAVAAGSATAGRLALTSRCRCPSCGSVWPEGAQRWPSVRAPGAAYGPTVSPAGRLAGTCFPERWDLLRGPKWVQTPSRPTRRAGTAARATRGPRPAPDWAAAIRWRRSPGRGHDAHHHFLGPALRRPLQFGSIGGRLQDYKGHELASLLQVTQHGASPSEYRRSRSRQPSGARPGRPLLRATVVLRGFRR